LALAFLITHDWSGPVDECLIAVGVTVPDALSKVS
jgi:hypothetical protein